MNFRSKQYITKSTSFSLPLSGVLDIPITGYCGSLIPRGHPAVLSVCHFYHDPSPTRSPFREFRVNEVARFHTRVATVTGPGERRAVAERLPRVGRRVVPERAVPPTVGVRESLRVLQHERHLH